MKLRENPLCEECERINLLTSAVMVHHIIPIEDGGEPLDWENLMSLCDPCHCKKHSNAKEDVGGCGVDGLPVHPDHPWAKR